MRKHNIVQRHAAALWAALMSPNRAKQLLSADLTNNAIHNSSCIFTLWIFLVSNGYCGVRAQSGKPHDVPTNGIVLLLGGLQSERTGLIQTLLMSPPTHARSHARTVVYLIVSTSITATSSDIHVHPYLYTLVNRALFLSGWQYTSIFVGRNSRSRLLLFVKKAVNTCQGCFL